MRVLMSAGAYDIGGSSTVMKKLANKFVENGHEGALWFRRFPSKGAFSVARLPVGNVLKLRSFLKQFDDGDKPVELYAFRNHA
jgi:hypothetical protein